MKKAKKLLSLVLALVMCLSMVNLTVFADNAKNGCGIHDCECGQLLIQKPAEQNEVRQCPGCGCVWIHKGNGKPQEGSDGAEWKDPTPCPHKDITTGESWVTEKVTTQPDCIHKGEKTYTCTKCGGTWPEEIPALEHNFEGAQWVDNCDTHVEADCTDHTQVCTQCEGKLEGGTNSEPHTFGDWSGWATYEGTDHNLTLTDGQTVKRQSRVCAVCGHTEYKYQAVGGETPVDPEEPEETTTVYVYVTSDTEVEGWTQNRDEGRWYTIGKIEVPVATLAAASTKVPAYGEGKQITYATDAERDAVIELLDQMVTFDKDGKPLNNIAGKTIDWTASPMGLHTSNGAADYVNETRNEWHLDGKIVTTPPDPRRTQDYGHEDCGKDRVRCR